MIHVKKKIQFSILDSIVVNSYTAVCKLRKSTLHWIFVMSKLNTSIVKLCHEYEFMKFHQQNDIEILKL